MSENRLLTVEDFTNQRFDLPEGGRWHELNYGKIVRFHPPDDLHGAVVLNLGRLIGNWASTHPGLDVFPVFNPGLIMQRGPDSVLIPPVAFFCGGNRFDETDRDVTESCPTLVIEIASTNDRRKQLRDRLLLYQERGVQSIWVVDSADRQVQIVDRARPARVIAAGKAVSNEQLIPHLSLAVDDLFVQPEWWR